MIQVARGTFAGGTRSAHAAGAFGHRVSSILARYDNAQTTDENKRQWAHADPLSAKSANSPGVRRALRTRSRYEVANNPYLFGVCNSNADDLVGTGGPTLQVKTADAAYNRAVEESWAEWCAEVDLVEKLRTCKVARTVDGEGFLVLKTADLEHPVKLYPVDVEADQVTTPAPKDLTELWVDGLTLDPVTGKPRWYHVLKHHPGDYYFPDLNPLAVERVPARYVIHWFPKFRPGQVRGVPVFTPSLDLFTELRSFRKAVLANAQIAASLTAVLESEAPADTEDAPEVKPYSRVPIDRGFMTTIPAGFKLNGFDPKQPQTTYEMFSTVCLGEAIRPLAYPLNLALGSSQRFNFSSSKLDHINYRNALTTERDQCAKVVLERLFRAWYEEAVLCGAIPAGAGLKPPVREWHWPGYESIDPLSDAQTDSQRLAAGTLTLREFWGRRGQDWRDVLAQLKTEMDEIARLGLAFGDVVKRSVTQSEPADDEVPTNAA